jgi:hypothetical protein
MVSATTPATDGVLLSLAEQRLVAGGLDIGDLDVLILQKVAADNKARYAKLRAMAHHKRRRPKHRRSGCLLCKPTS